MKYRILSIFAAMMLWMSAGAQASGRSVENFNFGWKFMAGDPADAAARDFDDSRWTPVNLPHDYQISQPWVEPDANEKGDTKNSAANTRSRLSARGFKEMGAGWYRKTFKADPAWKDRRVLLDFEGIMLTGDVYVNGKRVGGTDYGYLGFEANITPLIDFEGDNVVAVRADTGRPENSRWYTGGGLYRNVSLVTTDPRLHFTRHPLHITTPLADSLSASVVIDAELTNAIKDYKQIRVKTTIKDADGLTVYSDTAALPFNRKQKTNEYRVDSLTLSSPRLWDCDSPHLYTLELSLLRPDGTVADSIVETFGVRTIEYSPDFGFKLNGKKLLLKGIANHHTLGALGAAAYPSAIEKRIRLLKDFGFNHIRTSHNPYSEQFLDLCDSYGILVVDELYDKWTKQNAGGRREWMELWPKDLPEWIRRDRNHPSVVMWSLGNELQMLWSLPYADWGVTPYRLQQTLLHRYDTTRPLTVAMHPRYRDADTDSLPAPLALATDIASYNYRYMYFPGDSRRFPGMIFYQSEANTSGMGPNFYEMDLDRVVGLAYWGMIDYLGESAGWPAKGWAQGIFDISLEPKPIAWFLRSIFKPDEPTVHIGVIDSDEQLMWNDVQVGTQRLSDHWNRPADSKVTLYTFTNADEVELRLNGKSLGRKRNDTADPKKRNRIVWENVPTDAGRLEAFAYRNGESAPAASHRIETTGRATRLRAAADNPAWKADGMDLQHVRVEAIDSKKRRDPQASELLTFKVDGPAEVVAVVNGDLNSNEMMTGSTRSLSNGTATVILRSTTAPGPVTLTASAPGLKPVTVRLATE